MGNNEVNQVQEFAAFLSLLMTLILLCRA